MILKLKVLGGNQAGKELVVKKHPFLIGRSEECHLRPHTDEVSRKHCALEEADGKISAREAIDPRAVQLLAESTRAALAGDYVRAETLLAELEQRLAAHVPTSTSAVTP